jgi:hypothetical protein
VDLGEGATVTVSDAGERYLSVMVVSQDHYITDVLHDAGQYELDMNVVGSRSPPISTPSRGSRTRSVFRHRRRSPS